MRQTVHDLAESRERKSLSISAGELAWEDTEHVHQGKQESRSSEQAVVRGSGSR